MKNFSTTRTQTSDIQLRIKLKELIYHTTSFGVAIVSNFKRLKYGVFLIWASGQGLSVVKKQNYQSPKRLSNFSSFYFVASKSYVVE